MHVCLVIKITNFYYIHILIENTLRVDVQKYKALLSWYYSHHHMFKIQIMRNGEERLYYIIHMHICLFNGFGCMCF